MVNVVLIDSVPRMQVVWKATTDLGCGAANCKDAAYPTLDATIFVCRYWTQVHPVYLRLYSLSWRGTCFGQPMRPHAVMLSFHGVNLASAWCRATWQQLHTSLPTCYH